MCLSVVMGLGCVGELCFIHRVFHSSMRIQNVGIIMDIQLWDECRVVW